MLRFLTYIIQSEKNGKYYVGHSENITERLACHNNGRVVATRNKGPWQLVYTEEYDNKLEANRRELEIKSKKSRRYIEYLITMRK